MSLREEKGCGMKGCDICYPQPVLSVARDEGAAFLPPDPPWPKKDPQHLPSDAKARKGIPLATGVVDYFPDALVAVARLSQIGNDQHNPGQPLHWSREKSTDHRDTLLRHFTDAGTLDTDGVRHSAKVAWRALAILQLEIEGARLGDLASPAGKSAERVKPDWRAATTAGWVAWNGGFRPVAALASVEYVLRSWNFERLPYSAPAGALDWGVTDDAQQRATDIVAYRVVRP